MGVDFFKLDFLYAAALPEYKDKTRCQVQNEAYELLRDTLKNKIILVNSINSTQMSLGSVSVSESAVICCGGGCVS